MHRCSKGVLRGLPFSISWKNTGRLAIKSFRERHSQTSYTPVRTLCSLRLTPIVSTFIQHGIILASTKLCFNITILILGKCNLLTTIHQQRGKMNIRCTLYLNFNTFLHRGNPKSWMFAYIRLLSQWKLVNPNLPSVHTGPTTLSYINACESDFASLRIQMQVTWTMILHYPLSVMVLDAMPRCMLQWMKLGSQYSQNHTQICFKMYNSNKNHDSSVGIETRPWAGRSGFYDSIPGRG
jgi:hypothetical protein